jgi:hypothetical protein
MPRKPITIKDGRNPLQGYALLGMYVLQGYTSECTYYSCIIE